MWFSLKNLSTKFYEIFMYDVNGIYVISDKKIVTSYYVMLPFIAQSTAYLWNEVHQHVRFGPLTSHLLSISDYSAWNRLHMKKRFCKFHPVHCKAG